MRRPKKTAAQKQREYERVAQVGLHTLLDGWVLMLLWGLLHLNYGWPTFTIAYWHATLIVFLFWPVFSPRRNVYTESGDDVKASF